MTAPRKPLSKKTRFEVFKRDKFTCQYCGAKAPDAVLHVDHIDPVALGGTNAIINLVTACQSCNGGKGARRISDDSVVLAQRAQSDELQTRREQLDMMLEWQRSLASIDNDALEQAADFFKECVPGFYLNEMGRSKFRRLAKRYGLKALIEAISEARAALIVVGPDGCATEDAADAILAAIPRLIKYSSSNPDPNAKEIAYICGTVKRRFRDWEPAECGSLVTMSFNCGVGFDVIYDIARTAQTYEEFIDRMLAAFDRHKRGQDA